MFQGIAATTNDLAATRWPTQHAESTRWSRYQDITFEQALLMFPEDMPGRWQWIASQVSGKSPAEVKDHYDALVHDVFQIESGRVEVPSYQDYSATEEEAVEGGSCDSSSGAKAVDRKKGKPWTEDEHRRFLIGLQRFGKGDWRSISRACVVTRSPTQVASHAQKYFLRQCSERRVRKRASIHDTKLESDSVPLPMAQMWVPPPDAAMHHSPEMLQQQLFNPPNNLQQQQQFNPNPPNNLQQQQFNPPNNLQQQQFNQQYNLPDQLGIMPVNFHSSVYN